MYSTTKASDLRLGAAAVALTAAILAVGAVLPLAGWPIAVLVSRRRHPPANRVGGVVGEAGHQDEAIHIASRG